MSSNRISKLNNNLRDEVAKILQDELTQQDKTLVTVVGAEVSPTLEHAAIRISVYPKSDERMILSVLKKQIYEIQQILNRRLVMRPVPKIRFEIDTSKDHASRIEEILQKIPK